MSSIRGLNNTYIHKKDGYIFSFWVCIGAHVVARDVKVFIPVKMNERRRCSYVKMLMREARKRK